MVFLLLLSTSKIFEKRLKSRLHVKNFHQKINLNFMAGRITNDALFLVSKVLHGNIDFNHKGLGLF